MRNAVAAVHDPRQVVDRVPIGEPLDQLRKRVVGLAGTHKIHVIEQPMKGLAHDRFEIRAAEHRENIRATLFDAAGERQGREILLE